MYLVLFSNIYIYKEVNSSKKTMPLCSIVGCRRTRKTGPVRVTLHRLPKVASKRKQWLDIIGVDNIITTKKNVSVCSQHFEHSCFNRTLNIIKLHDDALPSRSLLPNNQTGLHNTSVEIKEEEINDPDPLLPKDEDSSTNSIPDNDRSPESSDVDEPIQRTVQTTSPISEIEQSEKYMSVKRELITTTNKMTIMKERCAEHRRKIRALKEKIRRANKNIVKLKNHVKDLKMHKLVNDKNIVQERPVAKAKLPKRKKVKEEMSSSKLTVLHFLAPNIAYEFIRR